MSNNIEGERGETKEDLNDWNESYQKAKDLYLKVINILVKERGEEGIESFNKRINGLIDRKGREELDRYAAFHGAIGSTTTPENSPLPDLEGDDSIVRLLEEILEDISNQGNE